MKFVLTAEQSLSRGYSCVVRFATLNLGPVPFDM